MVRAFAIAVLLVTPFAVSAVAKSAEVATVRTSDLDLSRPADIARLETRVKYAITEVCGNADDVFPEAAVEIHTCERDTRGVADRLVQTAINNARNRLATR